ncbi:hypothetical protein CCP3SC1AL1_160030 [Gammaproteobacteria bacterium]
MQKFWSVVGLTFYLFTARHVMAVGEEAKCRQWALEDGVPAQKVAAYVRACAAEISSTASETSLDFLMPSVPAEETRQTSPVIPVEE